MFPAPGVYDAEMTDFVITVSAWMTPLALTNAAISRNTGTVSSTVGASVSTTGFGETMPLISPDDDETSRELNRRDEIGCT